MTDFEYVESFYNYSLAHEYSAQAYMLEGKIEDIKYSVNNLQRRE